MRPAPVVDFSTLLEASRHFPYACLLHSNGAAGRRYDWLAALGARRVYEGPLPGLHAGYSGESWLFGTLSYDLKNELVQPERAVGKLVSTNPDRIGWPDCCWFEPEYLWVSESGMVRQVLGGSLALPGTDSGPGGSRFSEPGPLPAPIATDFSFAQYQQAVQALREHIREGDVYEVNLCAQFSTKLGACDIPELFRALNASSQAPFAGYCRMEHLHLLCASPERFLARSGPRIWSQPIKGTAPRGENEALDAALAAALEQSEKDRAENIMIVDLVRNDLSHCCEPGSVRVPELCGLHTFATLHHLISTVEGRLKPGLDYADAWRACFPMGSMTGAPKIMALDLIERYECSRRGIYSGALGYLAPGGDFDSNVVIRSLALNEQSGLAVWGAGGAITWDSQPELEWDELHVKASAIRRVLLDSGLVQPD